jgi:hypothetical protein
MRIPVSSIVDSQLPLFVREEYPLFVEFLRQYYLSDKSEELVQNLDKNIDIDVIFNINTETSLTQNVGFNDSIIAVESTEGFPENYGLIKINNEIILYTSKTNDEFLDCKRGFSGITNIDRKFLEFSESERERHLSGTKVLNLSAIYLQQFAIQTKKKITPGFEDRDFFSGLNASNFAKNAKTFYSSKGSDESFRILFGALYGKPVDVIKPRDFLIRPSDAQYRVTKDLVVEVISGDPYSLINTTIYQDPKPFVEPAQGTVIEVTKIIRKNKEYFVISLDFDYNRDVDVSGTIKSEFSIHPKTLSTSRIPSGSNYIDVDSTVGFPNSGNLKIDLSDGTSLNVNYANKVLNQFLDCTGITEEIPEGTEIKVNSYIYGFDPNGNEIRLFITGVLGDIDYVDDTFYYEPNDKIKLKTLGDDLQGLRANNWFFNISITYDVEKIQVSNLSSFVYKVTVFDDHNFVIGDKFTLYASDGTNYTGNINFIESEKTVIIENQGQLNPNLLYTIRKNISKVNAAGNEYEYLNVFNSNVQNIYTDYDKNTYVSTPSFPTYLGSRLNIRDFTVKIPAGDYSGLDQIQFPPNTTHGLYTGDSVVLKSANKENSIALDGVYFVYRVSSRIIKLANSLSNIYSGLLNNQIDEFVKFSGSIKSDFESLLEPARFNDLNFKKLPLRPQNIIRKLEDPQLKDNEEVTEPGTVGIFLNGVEISNYKSEDISFYGKITKIDVLDGGSGYSVLEPPKIGIIDSIGIGASLVAAVEGSLEKIDVIDPGFNYVDTPKIRITGGSGSGAEAIVKLASFVHTAEFNSETAVDTVNNIIEFNFDHKFADNEQVIYFTNDQKNVSGIVTNSKYFVKPLDAKRVQLYYTLEDASVPTNPVNITDTGRGVHSFASVTPKKGISKIVVTNPGSGYKNKKLRISGINTAADTLEIIDHGYTSGEIIQYKPTSTPIGGLSVNQSYYVTVVDNDLIRLSGISSIGTVDEEFKKKQYVDLSSFPTNSIHYFNYPDIKVELTGKIGISTFANQDFRAQIQPVFSGSIYSVFVENGGERYGSAEILNYERKPEISIEEGRNAQVTPVIINGSISRVIVNSPGSGYQQIPNLVVGPTSEEVILTPVISGGLLVNVIIISGGKNLSPDTTISVVPKGSGAQFNANIQKRRVNLVEKLVQSGNITNDDGFIIRSNNSLQYAHLYAPRLLRKSVLRKIGNINVRDLNLNSGGIEQLSTVHSPLIGWAYDGNPIYGPYGYSNGNSGPVKLLKTSYKLKADSRLILEGRPPLSIYPAGFFVEDYFFDGTGDLDENNGRYCVTPEFPQGTYAYFCTISIETDNSAFLNYFVPEYPYIIGPSFKNKKINNTFTFEDLGNKILRNTTPYKLLSKRSNYEFFINPNRVDEETLEVIKTKSSIIDKVDIIDPGIDYKVGDLVVMSDKSSASVSLIEGVGVSSIGVAHTTISNLEVVPYKNSFIGILPQPHNINNTQSFTFNSQYELNKKIKVSPVKNELFLSSQIQPISQTGIITYFNVNGNLDFPLKENDIYSIENEKLKILSVDQKSSRIKVERGFDGSVGVSTYNINTSLSEIPRKLSFNIGISTYYQFKLNREYYFNPSETLGIGTVGNYTLSLENVGLGLTSITIPTKTLFVENHDLNSGDSLFYSSNGGSPIQVSNSGIGTAPLFDNQELFVRKINNNLISISTSRSIDDVLSFETIGTGVNHSFKTNFENSLIGNISKNTVTVTTKSPHGLSIFDNVDVKVSNINAVQYSVFYNDYNRRICINKRLINSVDLINNIIVSENHQFTLGEKVIYVANSTIGGLIDQKIYYVIPLTKDNFKLAESYYDSITFPLKEINLTSSGNGFFYSINPQIKVIPNQDIIFDVSDPSLSFIFSAENYSAFELKLYKDENLLNEYFTYDITKFDTVGIDPTAKYILSARNIPNRLYYKFSPVNVNISPDSKKGIFFDDEQVGAFTIEKANSKYSGRHSIISAASTTFSYDIFDYPEANSYTTNSILEYSTDSKTALGPIHDLKIRNIEFSRTLPSVVSITTENGKNAILSPTSSDIGRIENIKKLDIGFDYTVDYTIRPKTSIPKIVRVERLFQIDSIDVINKGSGYSVVPRLVLIDQESGIPYQDAELIFKPETNSVKIVNNSNKIRNNNIKIVSINNDNGFDINEITFNSLSKVVTVQLRTPFNSIEEFPFSEGERVYIEDVPVLNGSGYNSINYGYKTFEIISSTPNIGGVGATFSYQLDTTDPGIVDDFYTSGVAIPEKYLPTFDVKIKTNNYIRGEVARTATNKTGEILDWDAENSIIKVFSNQDILPGDVIFGETSKNYSKIIDVYSPEAYIDIESSSTVNKGWKTNVGFLNDSLQRIHDSDYYQYFSYELRSEESYTDWTDAVDSLNHTAGFKKFGNLLVNSTHDNVGFEKDQNLSEVEVINDLQSVMDVNCFHDFDIVTENSFDINGTTKSNEIYFNSRRIQNYIESIGNKVVLIDDISDKFVPVLNDNNTIVDRFNQFSHRYKKYIVHIFDRISPINSQALLINLIHNDDIVAISQYAIMTSREDLGTFDAIIDDEFDVELRFFPIELSNKIYSVNSFSFNIDDITEGFSSVDLGDVIRINSHQLVGVGTTTIVSIPDDKVAAKILILYSDKLNRVYYSDEINYVHNGAEIISNSYGDLNLGNPTGIGTYNLYYDDSQVKLDFYPSDGVDYEINAISIEFGDSLSSTTDSIAITGNTLESSHTSFSTPFSEEIGFEGQKIFIYSYGKEFNVGLHQVLIYDSVSETFNYVEILTMLNPTNQEVYFVEFGNLNLTEKLGTFVAEYSYISGGLDLYFTPSKDMICQVKIFSTLISRFRRGETLEV